MRILRGFDPFFDHFQIPNRFQAISPPVCTLLVNLLFDKCIPRGSIIYDNVVLFWIGYEETFD